MRKFLVVFFVVALIGGMFGVNSAVAQAIYDSEQPGSVLVFPKFDITGDPTNPDRLETYIRICDVLEGPKGNDSVYIRYNFVCPGVKTFDPFCRALDIERALTFKGCVNIKVRDINPPCPQGFIVAYAENANQQPISYNYLIGSSLILQPAPQRAMATQAVAIQSLLAPFVPTAAVQGPLQFDGQTYAACGQDLFTDFRAVTNNKTSDLTLVTLDTIAGAQNDPTLVDIDFWNKYEDKFSSSFEYVCWAEVPLAIAGVNFCDNDPRFPGNYCIDSNFLQANLGANIGQIEINNIFSQPLLPPAQRECVIATIEEKERAWMTQRKLYHDNIPVPTVYYPE
jgi:hypothetical protein